MECVFVYIAGDVQQCRICARTVKHRGELVRDCTGPVCIHLGQLRQNKEGATIKVKCGCNGKEAEQFHVAHECAIHKRCLPTLVPAKLEDWKQRPESSMYHLCFNCEDRTTK